MRGVSTSFNKPRQYHESSDTRGMKVVLNGLARELGDQSRY
jgi:hypothetical protein